MKILSYSIKTVLAFVAITVIIFIGCNNESKETDSMEIYPSNIQLQNELMQGKLQERESPFNVREINLYIDKKWIGNAVAYGCYRSGQAPGVKGPSDAELLEDLNIIAKSWNLIRTYGADDDTKRILEIIKSNNLPIKVIQGIWLQSEIENPNNRSFNVSQIMLGIELTKSYSDIIIAVSVANETQVSWSYNKMNLNNLISYIRAVRKSVDVPVTTADDYLYWNKEESKQLADELDFVFTHIHPLWNGQRLDNAIDWIEKIYLELTKLHNNHKVIIGETGWATDYNPDKKGPGEQGTLIKGEVSIDAQASFLIELNKWVDSNKVVTFLFEVFDETWKGGGESSEANHVEKHWGVYNEDRTPKKSFQIYLDLNK